MRKLLLIQPPTLAASHSGLYSLAALATYVQDECEVRVLDPSREPLETALAQFRPDVIGITSYTVTYPEAVGIMTEVRRLAPEALRIVGGVHISCLPESLDEVFDAGVLGDGEETLRQIMRAGTREAIPAIPGICYHEGGRVRSSPPQPVAVENLPVPRLDRYAPMAVSNGIVSFITARGCPFRCAFCYSPVMRRRAADYPVAWVGDQFEYAVKTLRADYLMLLDDTVTSDIARLQAIAAETGRRNLGKFSVAVNIRSSIVTRELCRALRGLNVVSWNCGFESGSDRVLRRIKGASASVAGHREMVRLAHEHGVALHGSFIFGAPGETLEDMEETLRFMEFLYEEKKAGRYRGGFWFFCATPFPGTAWWEKARAAGRVNNDMDWSNLDIKKFDRPLLLDETVSPAQWEDVIRRATQIVEETNRLTIGS